jgi:hypothetical protein
MIEQATPIHRNPHPGVQVVRADDPGGVEDVAADLDQVHPAVGDAEPEPVCGSPATLTA